MGILPRGLNYVYQADQYEVNLAPPQSSFFLIIWHEASDSGIRLEVRDIDSQLNCARLADKYVFQSIRWCLWLCFLGVIWVGISDAKITQIMLSQRYQCIQYGQEFIGVNVPYMQVSDRLFLGQTMNEWMEENFLLLFA